jgi:NAD(P)-dependent dehydrogenase (short-subunit alcohol dehydrogenase family)
LLRLGHFHKTFGRRSFRTNGTDTSVSAKELEGSPITVNVLVPGGPTDTPMISDRVAARKNAAAGNHGPAHRLAGFGRLRRLQRQRITAARWGPSLPPTEAAKRASRAIGWPELAADAVWLAGKAT